jgi:hypothetical protein
MGALSRKSQARSDYFVISRKSVGLYQRTGGAVGTGLKMDAAGNLYGATYFGESVFKLTPKDSSWTVDVLYNSEIAVTIGPDGAIYGHSHNPIPPL